MSSERSLLGADGFTSLINKNLSDMTRYFYLCRVNFRQTNKMKEMNNLGFFTEMCIWQFSSLSQRSECCSGPRITVFY